MCHRKHIYAQFRGFEGQHPIHELRLAGELDPDLGLPFVANGHINEGFTPTSGTLLAFGRIRYQPEFAVLTFEVENELQAGTRDWAATSRGDGDVLFTWVELADQLQTVKLMHNFAYADRRNVTFAAQAQGEILSGSEFGRLATETRIENQSFELLWSRRGGTLIPRGRGCEWCSVRIKVGCTWP